MFFFLIFQATVSFGWFCSSFVLLWLIYGLYKVELGPFSAAAFSSLSHTAWAMGLAWIVVACSSGHGGYVNKILSAPVIYPFSRVTYCAYLVHPIAIRFVSLNSDATLHLGSDSMVSAKLEGTILIANFNFYVFLFFFSDCIVLRSYDAVILIGLHNFLVIWITSSNDAENSQTKPGKNFKKQG